MKNIFSNVSAFMVGVLICVAAFACATDSDDANSNSIAVLNEKIMALTARVNELEEKLENVEENLDYEVIFQKISQNFGDGAICNCSDEIENIKETISNLQSTTPNSLFPKINQIYDNDGNWQVTSDCEYDDKGRLISMKVVEKETYNGQTYTNTLTYTISYDGNCCSMIKNGTEYTENHTFTFDDDSLEDCQAINYAIISMICGSHMF